MFVWREREKIKIKVIEKIKIKLME